MLAYISQTADQKIINALKQEGFDIITLAPFSALENPVDTHADMLFLVVDDILFVHKNYSCEIKGFKKIIAIDESMGAKYPSDVLLNIAIVGKHVFANTKHASKTVLDYLTNNGFVIHHVSQGYAHCSTCIVSDNAIITADKGIAEAAQKAGLDALLINEGHISLHPYNHGFIGGCSGSNKDKMYFCGSLKYHPDGDKIREFCKKHGKNIIELCDAPLTDIGGILFK